MKYIIILSALISLIIQADELKCSTVKDTNNVRLLIPCLSDDCLELKNIKGEKVRFEKSFKKPLQIKKARLLTELKTRLLLEVSLHDSSSCWLEKVSGERIGKELIIAHKDRVLVQANLMAKLKDGFQISWGIHQEPKETLLKICRELDKNCRVETIKKTKEETEFWNKIFEELKEKGYEFSY